MFWQYCCNAETDKSSINKLILCRDYIVAICLSEPYPIKVELKLCLLYYPYRIVYDKDNIEKTLV